MAKITIPERYKSGFEVLANLDEKNIEKLSIILKKLPVGASLKTLQNLISEDLYIKHYEELSNTLYSLGSFLTIEMENLDELPLEIAKSFDEERDNPLNSDQQEKITRICKELLQNDNIKSTFKALNLLTSNEKIFRDGKIFSDIRLVFNDDLYSNERNAVIIHQLKIEYSKDGNVKDFYVSLDTNDLSKLKVQLERAIQKEETIRNNYDKSISYIKLED